MKFVLVLNPHYMTMQLRSPEILIGFILLLPGIWSNSCFFYPVLISSLSTFIFILVDVFFIFFLKMWFDIKTIIQIQITMRHFQCSKISSRLLRIAWSRGFLFFAFGDDEFPFSLLIAWLLGLLGICFLFDAILDVHLFWLLTF